MATLVYGGAELSLERAKRRAPQPFAAAYDWFIAHEGLLGKRPLGADAPQSLSIKIAAQRGIQKPTGFDVAISISSTGADTYADDRVHHLDDGTWVMIYCAHHQNAGAREASQVYNRSLINCLKRGLPVGVFLKDKTAYRCLGLAFIERYDSDSKLFVLHGPVRPQQNLARADHEVLNAAKGILAGKTPAPELAADFDEEDLLDLEAARRTTDLDERERLLSEVVRRKGQQAFRKKLLEAYDHQCVVTGCPVSDTLQAAHITSYFGPASQRVTNGLLLRADIHILYDRYLLSVDPEDHRIHLASSLMNSPYASLDRRVIRPPRRPNDRPEDHRLAAHFAEFKQARQQ